MNRSRSIIADFPFAESREHFTLINVLILGVWFRRSVSRALTTGLTRTFTLDLPAAQL